MTETLTNKLTNQLEYYANYSHLECDGLTQVFHQLLDDKAIPHTIFIGVVTHSERTTPTHLWIDLDDGSRIDYRLQRWLGASLDIPHGIFDPKRFTAVNYQGKTVEMPILPKAMIDVLLEPVMMSKSGLSQTSNKRVNPPLTPALQEMLGKPVDEARTVAERCGYMLEVLISEVRVNSWGEEEKTGWTFPRSPYNLHKLNVALDESGNVISYDY